MISIGTIAYQKKYDQVMGLLESLCKKKKKKGESGLFFTSIRSKIVINSIHQQVL